MTDYTITFARSARKELESFDAHIVNRILPKIESLAQEPRPGGLPQTEGGEKPLASSHWRLARGVRNL